MNLNQLMGSFRCQHLEQTLQAKERELEQTQVASFNSKLEFENRIKAMNDELDTLKQREHDLLSVSDYELMTPSEILTSAMYFRAEIQARDRP